MSASNVNKLERPLIIAALMQLTIDKKSRPPICYSKHYVCTLVNKNYINIDRNAGDRISEALSYCIMIELK